MNVFKDFKTNNDIMTTVEKIHYVDDKVFGYRFGYIFWFSLYAVSVGVLSGDDTTGHQRDYLTHTSLMSCLSLVYYSYNHFVLISITPPDPAKPYMLKSTAFFNILMLLIIVGSNILEILE